MPGAVVFPLLLAAANTLPVGSPVPMGSYVPYNPPAGSPLAGDSYVLDALSPVETFDPAARAAVLAQSMPRSWNGTYQPFDGGSSVPVELKLATVTAFGQMVDLRGEITVGSVITPVQGNLNAKSDQLDLLLLCECNTSGLELGGSFLGLQGVNLSGWVAPRLTHPGGQLVLNPSAPVEPAQPRVPRRQVIRGLW